MTTPKPLTRRQTPNPTGRPLAAQRVVIVAIAGGSGAGKSWLAQSLARKLRPHAAVVALDDFYRDLASLPPSRRERMNFDAPDAIDWELFDACLDRIRNGRPVALPRYDFVTHSRRPQPRRWTHRTIVIVEGLWPWANRAQHRHYALRIFREGPESLRLTRRLARDQAQRGRTASSIRDQWKRNAEPMRRRHVQPQALSADLRLGATVAPADLAPLAELIRRLAGLESLPASPATSARAPGA